MKRYPLGVQSFEKIIQGNYVYVDKTRLVYELANGPAEYIFLSRPRRFGKTLLTTTLKAYFEGKKELFKGLAMEKLEQNWMQYPVLHLSLTGFKVDVEYPTPTGRIDLVLYTPLTTYIIECKVRGSAEAALQQIITRDYPARFALSPRPLTLIGLSFSIEERNLTAWVIEPCPPADATKA